MIEGRLEKCLDQLKAISEAEYGFRKGKFIIYALIEYVTKCDKWGALIKLDVRSAFAIISCKSSLRGNNEPHRRVPTKSKNTCEYQHTRSTS